MNALPLYLGVLFSSIGLGYFIYGKRQKMTVTLICGLLLMLFTYFIESTTMISMIGLILSIVPYFLRF
ncbi:MULTISPECIES: amino acid transport protein [Acinetobacter]|uniref:Amino acid transport protein n=1 Tax=Acinetobacter junii TaxID=40215 RepID=A0A365PML3_ACIJU|nr:MULTISPECIES: amino acid transport protein [Acinetobacter]RBA38076.1 amino acid transport protein [Acinetobacter junii]RBA42639.1 amino acid transport protein [Acinetobacter junii]RBA50055.1 amino acid transport protein [Acinetobacter junii]WLF73403.1 amino acid transport protein [Acinetobacter junii]